jgi:hypothetical protein
MSPSERTDIQGVYIGTSLTYGSRRERIRRVGRCNGSSMPGDAHNLRSSRGIGIRDISHPSLISRLRKESDSSSNGNCYRTARSGFGLERAMGIENTAGAHQPLEIMMLQTRRVLRVIIV